MRYLASGMAVVAVAATAASIVASPEHAHAGSFRAQSAAEAPTVVASPTVQRNEVAWGGSVDAHGRRGVAYYEYGTTYKLGKRTPDRDVTGRGRDVIRGGDDDLDADTTYYWRMVIEFADGDKWLGEEHSFKTPKDLKINPDDPCPSWDTSKSYIRVNKQLVIDCSGTIKYSGSLYQGSGQSGKLICPARFPRNLNATSLSITIPYFDKKLPPFGYGIDQWRSSPHVRLNLALPWANKNYEGQGPNDVKQGWQDWDATNWTPSDQTARYWIYCTNDFSRPSSN